MFEEPKRKTRILLADDQQMVRQGIQKLLQCEADFQVVGETDNGPDAVKLAHELTPDVVLMEAHMPKLDTVEVTRRIKSEHPQSAILILTSHDDEENVVSLIGAGVDGYMLKSDTGQKLVEGIRLIRMGEFVSNQAVAQQLFRRATRQQVKVNSVEHLTRRELEVLRLASLGMNNRDIAHELGLGLRTTKGHFESIFSKMGVKSRTEAVLQALKQGWVSLTDIE